MPAQPGISAIAVDDSVEALLAHRTTAANHIYLTVVAFIVVACGAVATTSVTVAVRAQGTLAPAIERQTLRSQSDGLVDRVFVSVGQRVSVGDTVVALAAGASDRARGAVAVALAEQQGRYADMALLLRTVCRPGQDDIACCRLPCPSPPGLRLERSKAVWRATEVEWRQASVAVTRAELARDRLATLAARGFGALAELETATLDVARAREERELALEHRKAGWAEELADARQQTANLARDAASRRNEQASHYVIAPVSGTVEELMSISAGSVVRAGDPVAMISPTAALVADVAVAPRDVGYLRAGMPARLLIEGYDVQEWGAADAVVSWIASDYTLVDGRAAFRVRVRPLRTTLTRADGRIVKLGKGLRFQVRFILGQRRLAELATRRAREWFDPAAPLEAVAPR